MRLLKKDERSRIKKSVAKEQVLAYVLNSVPSKLVSSMFPERKVFRDSLLPQKISYLIESAVTKFDVLYDDCSTGSNKSSKLFIKWLDYERSVVCVAAHSLFSDSCASVDAKRTVLTLILSTAYEGILKQITVELEKVSQPIPNQEKVLPSDDTALHRICGWALKSVTDKVSEQCKAQPTEQVKDEMRFLKTLKLPKEQKEYLPESVKYLDRGGLTFMKFNLLPWMRAIYRGANSPTFEPTELRKVWREAFSSKQ